MFMQLGSLIFETTGPITDLQRRREYAYAEHAVIEGKPRLQYVGDQLEEINIGFTFSEAFCNPTLSLDELAGLADRHQAVPLLFGDGRLLGRYVVRETDVTLRETNIWGTVTRATGRIRIVEWTEYLGITLSARKRQVATAVKSGPKTKAKKSLPNRPASTNPRLVNTGDILRTYPVP